MHSLETEGVGVPLLGGIGIVEEILACDKVSSTDYFDDIAVWLCTRHRAVLATDYCTNIIRLPGPTVLTQIIMLLTLPG